MPNGNGDIARLKIGVKEALLAMVFVVATTLAGWKAMESAAKSAAKEEGDATRSVLAVGLDQVGKQIDYWTRWGDARDDAQDKQLGSLDQRQRDEHDRVGAVEMRALRTEPRPR